MSKLDAATIEKYEKSLAKDPNSKLFAPLAEAYREQGRLAESEALALEGVRRHPAYVGGYVVLGRVLVQKREFETALDNLRQAVELAPDNILAYQLMADAYLETGNPVEALRAHKMALFLNPMSERSQRAVAKLERLTAVEFEEDVFKVRTLAEMPVVDPSVSSIASGPVVQDEILERTLSLVDALIVRNDVEAALKLLRDADVRFPGNAEVASRLRMLDADVEKPEVIVPLPPRARVILETKMRRLKNVLRALDARRGGGNFEETI